MKNIIRQGSQIKAHKGKQKGNEMFNAHRLEGAVKNAAIKPIKKPKKVIEKIKNPLDKKITHFL